MRSRTPLFRAAWVIVALTLAALACTLQIGGEGGAGVTASPPLQRPSVEILQPAEGQTLAVGQTVSVRARATSPSGVTLVELLVNNVRVNSQAPAESLNPMVVEVVMDYTPDRPGTVVLAVQAYSGQIVGVPAQRTITVLPALSPGTGGVDTPQTIPQATATIFNPVCRARVNVGGLRMRTGPGTEYDIMRNFTAGDEPLIIGYADRSDGRWWQVSWSGSIGWAAAAYTTQLGNCGAIQPAVVPASPTPAPSVTPPPTQPGTTATPTLPDLFLTLLEGVSEIQLGANGTAQANFAMQVRNGGGQATGPFRVAVLKPDGQTDYFNVPGLAPGQTVDVPAPGGFIVVFNTPGVARILVTVDDQNAIAESNEANNQAYRDVVVTPGPATNPPPLVPTNTPEQVSAPLAVPTESISPLVAEPQTLPQAQPLVALGPISPANAGQVIEIAAMPGHGGTITGLDFNAAGTRLASSSRDGTARLWDVYLESELLILAGHNDRVQGVAFSPLGDQVASASLDGTVRLWDAASGASLLTLVHGAPVEGTAFSPDGSRVASAGENPDAGGGLSGLTRVWDARSGVEIDSFQTFGVATGVSFLNNNTLVIATAARDCSLGGGEVALFEIGSAEEALLTLAEGPTFDRLAVDPASGLIAASSQQDICAGNAIARVWTSGGALTAALDHGSNAVTGLAFNPGSTLLATTTVDGSVRLWDLSTSVQLAALSAGGSVEAVAFSPDGTRLASGGAADAVLLWGVG
ncbi:MAG: hypothetical protein KBH93_01655 [Anaerolineae bacterium]|nr:hypothetical protein [Anaerolineae bacterium]